MKNIIIGLLLAMFIGNVAIFFYKSRSKSPIPEVVEQVEDQGQTSPIPEKVDPPKKEEKTPDFVDVPKFRSSEESVYGDVISHSQEAPFGDQHGRATNAHETAHGIHSYLRNKYSSETGKKVNGFYVLNGHGTIVEEPKIRKSHLNKFLPQTLRSYRYQLYIAGQQEWDDTPLYIYDEWNAYILGGKCNVDDVQKGKYKGEWTDGVSGCLDFSIYAIALSMAIKDGDPEYWESNKQFRNFTIWNLKEAQKTYLIGHRMNQFKWDKQDALLKEFLNGSSAAKMREFVKQNLDGAWLDVKAAELNLTYEPHQCKTLKNEECHLLKKSDHRP